MTYRGGKRERETETETEREALGGSDIHTYIQSDRPTEAVGER